MKTKTGTLNMKLKVPILLNIETGLHATEATEEAAIEAVKAKLMEWIERNLFY